jgi:hypothetical protein
VTPDEARQLAREQNDRDHAAGLLPSRHVTDEAVLAKVARLVLASGNHDAGRAEPENGNGPPPSPRAGRRSSSAATAAQVGGRTGAGSS